LPKILERAGTSINRGEITGYYTILVEGDDMNDPIADSVRSIIDGHIVLTRELANQNQYPAIDVLKSISRVMNNIIDKDHLNNANKFKSILATYQKAEDLVNIGAYITGSNKKIDEAIQLIEKIREFLKQDANSVVKFENSISELKNIVSNN
jgi:flagellum-specific ATP synthase